jgi:hypothetical protein
MTAQRTSNTDINRALGRLEGAVESMAKAAEGTNANVSALLEHVSALRKDVHELQTQMQPVIKQTRWLEEKRAQGVGFLAAAAIVFAGIASAAGAFGGQIWGAVFGGDA